MLCVSLLNASCESMHMQPTRTLGKQDHLMKPPAPVNPGKLNVAALCKNQQRSASQVIQKSVMRLSHCLSHDSVSKMPEFVEKCYKNVQEVSVKVQKCHLKTHQRLKQFNKHTP